ncbi:MAG: terminase, partial [Gemmatimonadetes bacterium]|nr:terminase [Gemmatimonadota bacterium]
MRGPGEFVADDLASALDPVRLAVRAGITPDSWQADLLRIAQRDVLMLCSRQSGKSTVAALLAVHAALYRAPALVLMVAPALRQAQELYRVARGFYRALGTETVSEIEEESALRLELANGSRIISLPGSEATVRSYARVALLIIDEAARVSDELYAALRPMLAVGGGRLVLLSTP